MGWIAKRTATLQRLGRRFVAFQDRDPAEDPDYMASFTSHKKAAEALTRWGFDPAGTRQQPCGDATETVEVWVSPVHEAPMVTDYSTREEAEAVGVR